ncbi:MAG: SDR family oxidoreductase, partial [Chloroflexota bacterium]
MYDLKDRVAIVTGAGGMGGIGRAIALRLARDGAHVVLADIERPPDRLPPDEVSAGWRGIQSVAEEVRALGRRAVPVVTDITRTEQVERLVESAVRELGGVDILVNNARAVGNYAAPVVELDENEWDHVMAVNARGTFLCCRAVMRWMLGARRGGVIVNISSVAGRVGQAGNSAYSASKFAVIGFTQSLALEAAPHGIRVNDVCP